MVNEERELDCLKYLPSGLPHEWHVAFAKSGKEAMTLLSKKNFDVVLADTCVPDLEGEYILVHVMQQFPDVIRIALTSRDDSEGDVKPLVEAQQYLSNQCDAEEMKYIISRSCSLKQKLSGEALRNVISGIKSLPSVPSAYAEIMTELRSPDPSISRVGEIVAKDVGMTAKLLQLVNSAWFGLQHHISSPAQAVIMLGLEKVQSLVLYFQVFSKFDKARMPGFSIEDLAMHSMRTGMYAKLISETERADSRTLDHAFLAGLLHDVGVLILASNCSEQYVEIFAQRRQKRVSLATIEEEVLGVTHAELGAYLLDLWGLPQPIVEAVAFHHCPSKWPDQSFTPLTAVHVANMMIHQTVPEQGQETDLPLDNDYLSTVNLTDRVPIWRELCAMTPPL